MITKLNKKKRIRLSILAFILFIWGLGLIYFSYNNYYEAISKNGNAYYGIGMMSKDKINPDIALSYGKAKKEIKLSQLRNFTSIGIGLSMIAIGGLCYYRTLPRGQ